MTQGQATQAEDVEPRPAPKKSYARAVGNTSWPIIDSLPKPIEAINIRRIVIPQHNYESKRQMFRFALIGRVNFRLISLDDLHKEARENWKLSKGETMHPLGKGYVIFQFQCEQDKATIWQSSPLMMGEQAIRFQQWKSDFNIHEKQSWSKLVWVRFLDLPLEYWNENVLLSILNVVGHLVGLDRRTREGVMELFARVLVDVDILEVATRIEEVQVEWMEPGTTKVFGFHQKVLYKDGLE
ncbi:uncharacterized protein LOC122064561 [Macadamia integrifolia]|uniref:uncharacterized protein LOC122064561 n=1 Tax=Macadamia integrifolia TaxID=60698 RepID=UPI001C4F47C4|nr:uncharacterized protein LOC122064561 [Macadamia integrifolia]